MISLHVKRPHAFLNQVIPHPCEDSSTLFPIFRVLPTELCDPCHLCPGKDVPGNLVVRRGLAIDAVAYGHDQSMNFKVLVLSQGNQESPLRFQEIVGLTSTDSMYCQVGTHCRTVVGCDFENVGFFKVYLRWTKEIVCQNHG